METKKLNLNELKVDSFVTSLEGKDAQTVKGGNPTVVTEVLPVVMVVTLFTMFAVVGLAKEATKKEVQTEGEEQQKSNTETN